MTTAGPRLNAQYRLTAGVIHPSPGLSVQPDGLWGVGPIRLPAELDTSDEGAHSLVRRGQTGFPDEDRAAGPPPCSARGPAGPASTPTLLAVPAESAEVCVLEVVAVFRPYPRIRSRPMWASQIRPRASPTGVCSHQPHPMRAARQRCRVGDVVEGGPNAGAGQVAQCGQVREQQCHRDEPPGHAGRGVGDQRAREQRGGLEAHPPARLTDNGSARGRVLPPRVGVPPVTRVVPVQSVLRPSQRGSSRPLARGGRSFGRYRQAGRRRRGWVLPG